MNENRKPTGGSMRDVLPDIPYEAFEAVSRRNSNALCDDLGVLLEHVYAVYGDRWGRDDRDHAERLLAEWRDWA